MSDSPFPGAGDPFTSINPALTPNPPPPIPEAPEAKDATAALSPFQEAQDIDQIIKNLVLDRPLKLFIPNKDKYPEWEFRIINSIPAEIADAHNKGFKEVTEPELVGLFTDLVAGTDKNGKAFRPVLCARPKAVGAHIRKRHRMQLASLYAGMDPTNKEFNSKYVDRVDEKGLTKGQFTGAGFRVRV